MIVSFSDEQLYSLKKSQRQAFAEGTNRNLTIQWETFLLFCFYFKLTYLPAETETLSLYAQFLGRSFQSTHAIKNYISGFKTMHHLLGYSTANINDFLINLALRGISRQNPHLVTQAKPITPEILMSKHEVLDFSIKSDVVYWCLFLFAFFLFARKSNLFPDSDNYVKIKFLLREDVQICANTLIINDKWSKTIQFGERLLKIPLIEISGPIL